MGKALLRKEKQEYPGVRFDPELKKYIATYRKADVVQVATCQTFKQARVEMKRFENG